jgi:hypothetical protein
MTTTYPSIAKFQQLVQLKDYRPPTKKEYVRYVLRLADHLQRDPASASEDVWLSLAMTMALLQMSPIAMVTGAFDFCFRSGKHWWTANDGSSVFLTNLFMLASSP